MDPEHWALTPFARERLLLGRCCRGRLPDGDGSHPQPCGPARRRRAPCLGGTSPLSRDEACHGHRHALVEGVLAQLTSSALKNEDDADAVHRAVGFTTTDQAGLLIVGLAPAGHRGQRLGQPAGRPQDASASRRRPAPAGSVDRPADQRRGQPGDLRVHLRRRARHHTAGGRERDHLHAHHAARLAIRPCGRSADCWMAAARRSRFPLARRRAMGRSHRAAAAAQQHQRAAVKLGNAQEVVGHNNIGDVSFAWGAGDAKSVDAWTSGSGQRRRDPPKRRSRSSRSSWTPGA